MNVMRAVSSYASSVRTALEAGIDAVVVGAGLSLDLPDLAREHPKALLIPILSDAQGVALVVKKWERKQRLPDAIVIEHPRLAGGHLGAAKVADLTPTQLRVLLGVLAGRLNKQIAYDLSISEATVKAHMTAIMRKLDVQNRTQAVLAARALGIGIEG